MQIWSGLPGFRVAGVVVGCCSGPWAVGRSGGRAAWPSWAVAYGPLGRGLLLAKPTALRQGLAFYKSKHFSTNKRAHPLFYLRYVILSFSL